MKGIGRHTIKLALTATILLSLTSKAFNQKLDRQTVKIFEKALFLNADEKSSLSGFSFITVNRSKEKFLEMVAHDTASRFYKWTEMKLPEIMRNANPEAFKDSSLIIIQFVTMSPRNGTKMVGDYDGREVNAAVRVLSDHQYKQRYEPVILIMMDEVTRHSQNEREVNN